MIYLIQIPTVLYIIRVLENKYNNDYLSHKNCKEITDNIISIYHALYLIIGSILYLNNIFSMTIYDSILLHSILYTINDLIKLYKYDNKMKYELTIHHMLLIFVNLSKKLVVLETTHTYYVALNYLTEMSTPTLNLSHNLYFLNKKHTFLFKMCTIMTCVLYFLFRILLLIYLLIDELNNDELKNHTYQYTLSCSSQSILLLLNCYWFNKITKLMIKHNGFFK